MAVFFSPQPQVPKTSPELKTRNVAQDTFVYYSVEGVHCANTANLCSAVQGCSKDIRKKLGNTVV